MERKAINPPISSFVVFSGGGGLITRTIDLELDAGENQIRLREVPASFDPETFTVELGEKRVTLREFVIKKPNRQYVDDNLERKGDCAKRLIEESIELGERRREIIEICEVVKLRTYLDEEVDLVLWLDAPEPIETSLTLSYFIDDARFKWKPTLLVELDENWEKAHVNGFFAIENESAKRFDDVEVMFADFSKDMTDDTSSLRLAPEQFKRELNKQRMNVMTFK